MFWQIGRVTTIFCEHS